jgi:hypothetical protein
MIFRRQEEAGSILLVMMLSRPVEQTVAAIAERNTLRI